MDKELKTVDEHNAEVRKRREEMSMTGILCPACEKRELKWDNISCFTSYPPQRGVYCMCGYRGYVE